MWLVACGVAVVVVGVDGSAGDAGGKFQPPDGGKYDAVSANADKVPWPDDYNPYGQNERTKDMQSKYSGTTNVGEHIENVGWGGIVTGAIGELVEHSNGL